ncbi:magnesium transporter [Clostridium estertheticum]|uniref:CBS domain-containing protein n=1 Tax=Clostridium estertheticum TaxID=238834 RepID=A0AA47EJL1_9CLOT|nr:CBS domain-containing protein [Clostridium estertheticum]MBU3154323.1 CBS domain-containing protein [Clostridium estertheticum]MBU3197910.1 CBS domain-containing protein [Clostridium estertheticum]MBX4263519.1 CBS domain-containing protein [Clostridium estertheticum]MCB2353386.1 CBS domain-containing protein [Clostridium estertheticum]WAG41734.1 CBS domain-containing protein [Clostridium estertheticum]
MEIISAFFLSSILNKNVYDEFEDNIGKLFDIYVTTEQGYPRVIGYKIKKESEIFNYEFRNIEVGKEDKKITVQVRGVKEIIPRKFSYLLSKHLLNKQIVDVNGKKVVKVNDLTMTKVGGEIRVIAVESGIIAAARKYKLDGIIKIFYNILGRKPQDNSITWESVQSLEMVDHSLKLTQPYSKLTKLHPADLADILEGLDTSARNKIFESLDKDLAAHTLEELQPEVQADILSTINNLLAQEILDEMPNDEIADILDEMKEDDAEKILLNFNKDDEEEIRNLMNYEEEVVGSIMNKDFISFNVNITASATIEILRELQPEDEVIHYIYIVDEDKKLQGVISLRNLVLSAPARKLKDIMDDKVIRIKDSQDIEEAVEIALKYDLISLPVVDIDEKLCGIVIMNDIIEELLSPRWKRKLKKII